MWLRSIKKKVENLRGLNGRKPKRIEWKKTCDFFSNYFLLCEKNMLSIDVKHC